MWELMSYLAVFAHSGEGRYFSLAVIFGGLLAEGTTRRPPLQHFSWRLKSLRDTGMGMMETGCCVYVLRLCLGNSCRTRGFVWEE